MSTLEIQHFFDYKSPYAYLAQHATAQLESEFGVTIHRLPYTLDIPSYLGSAEVDAAGRVLHEARNAHQWRRVRYAYMDCRREASRRGLVLRGPRKIFDSRLAHLGFLFAAEHGVWAPYHAAVFAAFWRRELDLEDANAIGAQLAAAGAPAADFADWCTQIGRSRLERVEREAEASGVFGVPSWRVNGELFWGSERLPRIAERIAAHLLGATR